MKKTNSFFPSKLAVICLLVLALALALTACGAKPTKQGETPKKMEEIELTISAAASLTDSLKEIQTLYSEKYSHIKLNYNFGASGTLQQQIEQGAPADVFISAGRKQMQALVDKQLIDQAQQTNLLTNEFVLITALDAKSAIDKVEDLSKSEVTNVAIGQPESVPAGSYAKEVLTYYKLWDSLQSKLVLSKDVRQVLTYVETGNADAGFVYKTDALTSQKIKIALTVDPKSHKPIQYPIGLIKESKHSKEAQAFYDYLLSKEAQDVFVKYGFSLPGTD
ncbi:molybdate ABC transporter substrate-binding protein [Paenibacillus eucommiae]|uniref:Molybdate transport system substrate-binding protein n=1 Tax=Paenibacillus eucommiae TaxID=1355755 RepID=A0ABS4J2G1_9BACL|nr:molybdate ABC transporter substrate-binding protein [Paenibacillus eucommiae]MBP1994024.1 molybdate transport system substrate-binding protein [Paenibacillus eucommiae]